MEITFMRQMLKFMNNRLSELSGFLLMIIVFLVSFSTAFREFGVTIHGLVSMSTIVMVVIVYSGLSRAEEHGEHASIDLLTIYLSPKLYYINKIMVYILSLITVGIFFYFSIGFFIASYLTKEIFAEVVTLYIWPAKLAISIGLLFYLLQIIVILLDFIKGFLTYKKQDSN